MSQGQPLPPKNSEFLKFIFPLSWVLVSWSESIFSATWYSARTLNYSLPGTKTPSWERRQSNNLYTITTTIPNPPNMLVFRTNGKQNFTPNQVKWWEPEVNQWSEKNSAFYTAFITSFISFNTTCHTTYLLICLLSLFSKMLSSMKTRLSLCWLLQITPT